MDGVVGLIMHCLWAALVIVLCPGVARVAVLCSWVPCIIVLCYRSIFITIHCLWSIREIMVIINVGWSMRRYSGR